MRIVLYVFLVGIVLLCVGCATSNVKEAKYDVVEKDGKFEVRDYAPQILAETLVAGGFEDAGDKAFNRLFDYISGKNSSRTKIAMTVPVTMEKKNEKIAMTAPVKQQKKGDRWAFSFVMPSEYTIDTLPKPKDSRIEIVKLPGRRMCAVSYSGSWSKSNYSANKKELEKWMEENGYKASGEAIWARYNPPWTLWFLRRNEILFPVDK